MAKSILILGTLDTKEREILYLRKKIEAEDLKVILMDISCKHQKTQTTADISCETVTKEAGKSFADVSQLDKTAAVRIMFDGASKIAQKMVSQGDFDGIIALGGANGTEIACHVMRQLPVGFPKIMVSCVASGNVRPYVGTKDIIMINSIGDIALNRITKRIINNAAFALKGLIWGLEKADVEEISPQIAASVFAVTEPCVKRARNLLEEKGFEMIEFHASGGGRALEELVRSGEISGVLDITTHEIMDELLGGIFTAGAERLEAAGAMGVPQVISVGALDACNFGSKETIPEKYKKRGFLFYTSSITVMRTNAEENYHAGRVIAKKLNNSRGPTAILVPLRGFSSLDREGGGKKASIDGSMIGDWYDREADLALVDSLKNHIDSSKVLLKEIDLHINDPGFAEMAADLLKTMIENTSKIKNKT